MTQYDKNLPLPYVLPPEHPNNILANVMAQLNWRNLRVAETEKYAHVTYFFNGGNEKPYPGEERELVPSPKVATYDLKPEMSAPGIAEVVKNAIETRDFDVIVMNFANADMVGHSGKMEPTVRAVETVDACLGEIYKALRAKGGAWIITADHGNAETMIDPVTGGAAHVPHHQSRAVHPGGRFGQEAARRRLVAGYRADRARRAGRRPAEGDAGRGFAGVTAGQAPPASATVSSRQQAFHHVPVHVGQAEVAALELVGQPRVVDAQAVQDRGVQVVDVDGVVHDVVAEVVGLAERDAGLDAAAGHPDGEAAGVVVAAVVRPRSACPGSRRCGRTRRPRSTSVSSSRPRCFRSVHQRGGRLVGVAGTGRVRSLRQVAVLVPAAVEELDEAHAALGQPAGQQAVGGEGAGLARRRGRTGRRSCCGSFDRSVSSGTRGLHAEGHLVLGDAGLRSPGRRTSSSCSWFSCASVVEHVAGASAASTPGGFDR